MANTYTYTGTLSLAAKLKNTFGGDQVGSVYAEIAKAATFKPSGGDAVITGFVYGTLTVAAGDLLLAHATDPLQGMGDAVYSTGFTVAGSKLKLLYIENTHASLSITVARGAANGLPIFDAAGDSVTLAPGDVLFIYKPAGTAALTTGSNDKLTLQPSSGSPTAKILVGYGS